MNYKELAYQFYPKNLIGVAHSYIETKEHIEFLTVSEMNFNKNIISWESFLSELDNNYRIYESTYFNRQSLNVAIYLENEITLMLYVSNLSNLVYFDSTNDSLKEQIKNIFRHYFDDFEIVNKEVVNEIIEDISFEGLDFGEVTYFNVFFGYRLTHLF